MTLRRKAGIILAALAAAAPVLYFHIPLFYFSPDMQYVKAKILRVAAGELFADPISGYANFHPPFYHLFLSLFARAGVPLDSLLTAITVTNVGLIFLTAFLVLRRFFDEDAAFLATLLLPFVFQHMGPWDLFLATAFYFSVPLYLAGLWLYLAPSPTKRESTAAAVLWGAAFLVSPVYLFLIGFTFLYDLLSAGRRRRAIEMIGVFLLMLMPFFYQAYVVSQAGLAATSTFAVWRGWPDGGWFKNLALSLLAPVDGSLTNWQIIPSLALAVLGIIGLRRIRPRLAYPVITAIAYLFTAYHFSFAYASRILFFLILILAASAVQWLRAVVSRRELVTVSLALFIMVGYGDHLVRTISLYREQSPGFSTYFKAGPGLWANLSKYAKPDDCVLATDFAYRMFILPNIPVHGLLAYRSGEYFQLGADLSKRMYEAYNRLMESTDIDTIERICAQYNIRAAVASEIKELELPVFRTLTDHWPVVYRDVYFRIYLRPDSR